MIQTITTTPKTAGKYDADSLARLKKACSDFEAIFINSMLKSMRTAVSEDGILESNNEGQIIQSMFDENIAFAVSKGNGMGLGKMLFKSFS